MIGFDMGGTSTDVSRFAGSYEHVFESTTAGLLCHMFSSLASLPCPEAARPLEKVISGDGLMHNCYAGVTIQAPQLDINTVAAGGGSRLFFRTGIFQVCRHMPCYTDLNADLLS